MNRLTRDERAKVLQLLCEGMAIRAVSRVTGASKNTIAKLLVEAGMACAAYQDRVLRNLPCKRVQVDEIWSFIRVKGGNVAKAKVASADAGDVWTWIALDADTKLIASFYIGDRTFNSAREFIGDLAERLDGRIQLTSDGHKAYLTAVEQAFGNDIDYARLVKIYGQESGAGPERHYSPPQCKQAKLKMTPAMAAGVTDRVWAMTDLVQMIEAFEARKSVNQAALTQCLWLKPLPTPCRKS
jgi:IS1 family transposase